MTYNVIAYSGNNETRNECLPKGHGERSGAGGGLLMKSLETQRKYPISIVIPRAMKKANSISRNDILMKFV